MEEVKRIGNLYGEDRGTGFAGNVWDKNGLLPSLTTCQGGGREPMIIDTINDEEGICKTIKSQYGKTSAANFDRVSTFGASGVVDKTIKKVGQISSEGSEYGTVISEEGLCSNLVAGTHGYANSCICASEKMIVAMRGRNPENPTDRTPGIKTEQRLEPAPQGVVNTLTTVQKDNLVLEEEKPFIKVKQATQKGYIECPEGGCFDSSYPNSKLRRGRVQEGGNVTPTLTTSADNICYVETIYRIRKLTPRECWRLMSFTDEDYEKAESVESNTQLYKQAGNSICKYVLMAIFSQMNIKGVKKWNDNF